MTTTVRLLSTYLSHSYNDIVRLPDAVATALIAGQNATLDLTGGKNATPPAVKHIDKGTARLIYSAAGTLLGLGDSQGNLLLTASGATIPNGATKPGAPTSLTLTAAAGAVIGAFTAPASDGGSPIDWYELTLSNGTVVRGDASPIAAAAPAGVAVTATVRAVNGIDKSDASNTSNSVTPTGVAPSVPATAITLTGPTTGTVGTATSAYTVALSPTGGTVASPVTVTPAAVAGVTFAPTSLTLTTASPSGTFTATATTAGTKAISVTNNGGLANPAAINLVVSAAQLFKNTGTVRMVGTSAQVTAPSPANFAGGVSTFVMKIQAPAAAIGCRISVHNLSPVMGVNWVKASIAATDIAAVDTTANAYNAYVNGVAHNVTASGGDPLGFRKATWDGGATQSRRLEPTDAVLPSFGYNNQQDTVTSDIITGLVPKRATDRANEEYYYIVRVAVGQVQNYDGLCTPAATAITGPISEYTASNGADSPFWHGGDVGLTDGVDSTYTIPATVNASKMPVLSIEWIYAVSTPATTFVHNGDSITEGYTWPRVAVNRKSVPAKPLHHVNLGGSTTRTGSYLGNLYLYMQSNAKPDYVVMPIISINNYSPLSDFTNNLSNAQFEMARLQDVEAYLTGLGIKIIWWTPFNFGANPAPGDFTSSWGYLYNTAKAYAATKNITFMDINGDPRLVRSVYNASTNPTGWIAPDNTHPSNPPGIQGFATIYGETLTALGF